MWVVTQNNGSQGFKTEKCHDYFEKLSSANVGKDCRKQGSHGLNSSLEESEAPSQGLGSHWRLGLAAGSLVEGARVIHTGSSRHLLSHSWPCRPLRWSRKHQCSSWNTIPHHPHTFLREKKFLKHLLFTCRHTCYHIQLRGLAILLCLSWNHQESSCFSGFFQKRTLHLEFK